MAGATSRRTVPYMQISDPLGNVDAVTEGIAEKVDETQASQSGTQSCVVSAANTDLTVAVAFPVAFPAGTTVRVFLQPRVTTLSTMPIASPSAISESGFTLNFRRSSASNFSCDWLAVAQS